MNYNFRVNQLKDDISRKIHSNSLNKVTGIDSAIREGAINLLARIDPPETQISYVLENSSLYQDGTDIYTASVPDDVKQDKIVAIRPESTDEVFIGDKPRYVPYEDFITNRNRNTFTIKYDNGEKYILYFKLRDDDYELIYHTDRIFIDVDETGPTTLYTRLVGPESDDNLIGLESETYNILLYEVLMLLAQQTQGEDSGFDVSHFYNKLFGSALEPGLYKTYRSRYRSNAKRKIARYY